LRLSALASALEPAAAAVPAVSTAPPTAHRAGAGRGPVHLHGVFFRGKATVASHGPQMANGGKASAEALGEQFLREMVGYSEEE
jgi:hypothetical protein